MARNILTAENLVKYLNPARTGSYGINSMWTTNDGEPCMNLPPSPFYWTSDGLYYKKVLCDYFVEGKRYVFDLWIDSDTGVYQDVNRPQGITIYYTDGSSEYTNTTATGGHDGNEKGYQHRRRITPEGKSVMGIMFYYYTSSPTYYRWDSSITEYEETEVLKKGTIERVTLKEDDDTASIVKGGLINCNKVFEV